MPTSRVASRVASDHYNRIVYDVMLDDVRIGQYVLTKYNIVSLASVEIFEPYRGKGYGKWLVEDAIRNARKIAPITNKIELDVLPGNTVAISLYKKCGFVESKRYSWKVEMYRSLED